MSFDLFEKTILRALTYRIEDIQTIERIAVLQMKEANYQMPQIDVDEQFKNRQAYIDGRFSSEVDLSVYKHNDEDADG
jgi:hypothetical protein